jgi:hypothetical protein
MGTDTGRFPNRPRRKLSFHCPCQAHGGVSVCLEVYWAVLDSLNILENLPMHDHSA